MIRTSFFKVFNLIVVLLLVEPESIGAFETPGSSTAQFLKIAVSPRAAAMGNSYVSLANGAEAVYYNAAALIRVKRGSMITNHSEWFADTNLEYIGGAYRLTSSSVLGMAVTSFYTDQMEVRTPLQPDGTGETFSVNHYRIAGSFAKSLTDRVSFGMTLSYFHLKIFSGVKEQAYSSDIAVLYQSGFREFSFGIVLANVGSSITYLDKDYPMPLNFNFGLSINAIETSSQALKLSITGMKPSGGATMMHSGFEWSFSEQFFIRGGYRFNHDLASYSGGAGLNVILGSRQFSFDYSLSEFREFGIINRFGISTGF